MNSALTSADNKLFKIWQSLQTSKGIDKHGLAIVSGRRIVPELAATAGDGATLLMREGDTNTPPSLWEGDRGRDSNEARRLRPIPHPNPPPEGEGIRGEIRTAKLAPALFDELDEFGTHAPLLVIPAPTLAAFDAGAQANPRGLEIAVAAQDPANLGAILRSALAFGAREVILLQECAHAFLPRVTRGAAGANFHLALARGPSIRALTTNAIALDLEGEPLDQFQFPRDCRLLLGEEGAGIPASFKGPRVKIPISTRAESLNVAVAAGIALAAFRRQHPLV